MPQIIPIRDLKKTAEISDMCHNSEEPIYITKNGYGDMVIMSMETYEKNMRKYLKYKDIEVSEKEIEEGKVKEAKSALQGMRAKYGI
ncbi:type II toxin-antitoxin system Phd/YefM family antitoxin [Ruminococcus sp. AM30-15AC]|jgi:PHD/YefM family antitoxin component YafN of YafNO toxin-antitoxin module|nr:type II toxin-antitoxin system Phd/YefM family antitoxin [Ruminococcus sp. TM10-9AT]RGW17028.1 type II toxin-antitoxin system Phd/YefM family antitoxin [Ruminococcus sp. AF13-37]RGW19089.1 type II toxin-antitoxin system Phd/YefM family antitoxin [Ruminococcus sp. AF13-28]RHD96301.1 type II toxin-antitoxin system Phd/YefM family antitoxin [Ruminococcus sp. AM30-15AC]RHG55293.1 type II toxin-antitoxin system Phd/YefM family antitoxin [Ruminococcus sp. AM22-13]RHO90873.1 type II toxin-antitoxi